MGKGEQEKKTADKQGRNKFKGSKYRETGRREINKKRNAIALKKHLEKAEARKQKPPVGAPHSASRGIIKAVEKRTERRARHDKREATRTRIATVVRGTLQEIDG